MLWTRLLASETSVNTVCVCACVRMYMSLSGFFMLWTRFFLLRGLYICVCVCVCVYIYIYMYVCMCVYIYIIYMYIYIYICTY